MDQSYCYVWQFEVAAEKRADFERDYGPQGRWAALFCQAPGYVGTLLLADSQVPGRYLTIDRWADRSSYDRFREQFAAQYQQLDQALAALTLAEQSLGHFSELA